jgi:uridine kinase
VTIIRIDNYYKDRSNLALVEREKINYDHPIAFDIYLLINHLNDLMNNQSVDMPVYNFETHTREKNTIKIQPNHQVLLSLREY